MPFRTRMSLRKINCATADDLPGFAGEAERRNSPRLCGPFPAIARGRDATGEEFEIHTTIENFSADAFQLRLAQPVETGERLFVVARIHRAAVAMRVVVQRVETGADGACRLVVGVHRHRFLPRMKALAEIQTGHASCELTCPPSFNEDEISSITTL